MSEYLVLPIVNVTVGKMAVTACWVMPCVAQLVRIMPLVDTPMQDRAIAALPCRLLLGNYVVSDLEMRHLSDPGWLNSNVGRRLVLKAGEGISITCGELPREPWRISEVSLMAIVRLPPSCTPRAGAG